MEKLNIKSGKQIADRIREALAGIVPADIMRFYGAENYDTGEVMFCMSIWDLEEKYTMNDLKITSGRRLAAKVRKALEGMVPGDSIEFVDEFAYGDIHFSMRFLVPSMELLRGEKSPRGCVPVSEVPGLVVKDGTAYREAGGCLFPVGGVLLCNGVECIPGLGGDKDLDISGQPCASGQACGK
ncbi:hypothetical protein H9X86_10975 [Pseudoflavonifractor capillosus]|uniref:hypothetical protein n=1 Tax=Pseudoflavonifractor capillosus TaxID=106588 RepID=UPI00195D63CD|nr:hypothetical protein [Pseudoflavonifractor capillosus]MBM6897866.1 hypothetical protein [Pseudoflavonifractor capillosus]